MADDLCHATKCLKDKRDFRDKDDTVECTVCGRGFHQQCSGCGKSVFNAIVRKEAGVMWSCRWCSQNASGLFDMLKNMSAQYTALETKVDKGFADLEERVRKLEEGQGTGGSDTSGSVKGTEVVSQVLGEMREIEAKKTNVVVFGIEESSQDSVPVRIAYDRSEISKVLGAIGTTTNFSIRTLFRIGKRTDNTSSESRPRPLKVIFSSELEKREALRGAPSLSKTGFRNVFIRPDLTMKQREERNRMLKERILRRDNAEPNNDQRPETRGNSRRRPLLPTSQDDQSKNGGPRVSFVTQ